ncbi:MAG: ABC transporter ATP-binding protein [Desulfobacteraceae bacterium]|jgi:branched-chain amino acid transport system ATP-binding protein|nr:ABC transporter ATP-binding protein [Desulfobacteraceae bacterium]
MLRLVNVNSYYGLIHILKNVTLHVSEGEIVTMLGANGAGKTTTLRTISGLQPVRGGKIYFNDQEITGASPEKLVNMGIAHVPEGRQIFRPMSVYDNLELGGYLIYKHYGKKQLKADIEQTFALFPILKERRTQYAGTLSGGEQQMLTIAMALMSRPKLLLLDEPSMGLAPLIIRDIFQLIAKLQADRKLTVLLIEQNANAALKIADRGYVIETGKIVLEEDAEKLMTNQEVKRAYLGREQKEIWE